MFELDVDSGLLSREGVPVRLQPQPARVLALLIEHAGDVVSREALRQQVWNDGTVVDFERGLNFCIAQIRSALGDAAGSPRFVETLPRRGYRFIAPVAPCRGTAMSQARDADRLPAVAGRHRRWSYRRTGVAALIVLALATLVAVAMAARGRVVDRRVRIAVVPFDNETGMEGYDRVARAVADATVARLATPERVSTLSVIGNAAALFQPRAFRDLRQIGAELDADYIVLAQMKGGEARVRLIAHLIRVDDQVHLWAETYDQPDFTLGAQAEIAESIASAVFTTLRAGPSRRVSSR